MKPMSAASSLVYAPAEVRELDRIAIEELGIAGYELMSRAGRCVFDLASARWPAARRWLILCGAGNNAGDGYIVARLAMAAGRQVTVAAVADPHGLVGDAARAWEEYRNAGGGVVQFTGGLCQQADLVIDGLLGTGLTRVLEGGFLRAVEAVNEAGVPVLAIDIPSGLCGEHGRVMGAAVSATVTATFIGRKQGLYLGRGPDFAGEVVFCDLGVPLQEVGHVAPRMRLFDPDDQARLLPRRVRSAHKGDFGHVLVIGGNHGMGGAVRLAGEAALRSGAGLVSVATRPENVLAVVAQRPELMCRGILSPAELDPLIERASVIAIGPGLGRDTWAKELLARVINLPQPLVMDADALNLLAAQPKRRAAWVLTPHPGEAGRLLGISGSAIQADRAAALSRLTAKFGGVVVLKGCRTLVAEEGNLPFIIGAGNPGMGSAGMGDVLTGMISGLIAQRPNQGGLLGPVACAAYVHARAADLAAGAHERGLLATDLFLHLRACLNPAN